MLPLSFLLGSSTDTLVFFGLGALLVYLIHRSTRRSRLQYFPGPRGLPIVGNVFQMGTFPWLQMTKWSEEFGPIYSLNLGGTHAIVISSHEIASELLDKRSAIYSDRPRMIMTGEVLCGGLFAPFNPYGESWRRLRKAAYEGLNKTASEAYRPLHAREAVLLAEALHQDPSDWMNHINRTTASGVFSVSYNRPPFRSSSDPIIKRMSDFMHRVERSARPGAYLVDIFPWMMRIPDWLAKWKRDGQEWHKKDTQMFFEFYHEAKNRMLEGKCGDCLTTILSGKKDLTEKEAAWTAGSMFGAGFSTTSAVQLVFILAMVCNPEVMRKAQEEIDRVVGRKRLPTFEDRENMPYFRAIIRETFRWRSIGPLGLPHATTQDDVYEGHFIPKGTIVFYNTWGLNRAPGVFPEPDIFRPERYLDATGTQDYLPPYTHLEGHTTFGYGRRKCLGINVANNTLFLHLSTILWAFNIEKGKDANGDIVTPDPNNLHDEGMVVVPAPFPCEFVPRDADVLPILSQARSAVLGSD